MEHISKGNSKQISQRDKELGIFKMEMSSTETMIRLSYP